MRRFILLLLLVPLTAIIVLFSVANRHTVTVSLDPFHAGAPALAFPAPLFVLLFGALILGLVIGGMAAWARQGRWRRTARRAESEAERLRAELTKARTAPAMPPLPPARDAA